MDIKVEKSDIEEIAKKGTEVYEQIKNNYGEDKKGKFLAIEVDTKEAFLADTSNEAVEHARAKYTGKIFYVVKIGFSAVEVLSSLKRLQHA